MTTYSFTLNLHSPISPWRSLVEASAGITDICTVTIGVAVVRGFVKRQCLFIFEVKSFARINSFTHIKHSTRVTFSFLGALPLTYVIEEKPANEVRCVSRYFCSEMEDKPRYYDKDFWSGYLDMLVASRFNRFTLAYGLEYDFPRGVTDDYLHLPYPYLVDVPGHPDVHVMQLASADGSRLVTPVEISKDERNKNLEMLRYIAAETGARGLDFQLGIWTHAYEWTDSPNAYHRIEGLTPETHARYCRDALAIILKECPEIQELRMRVHGESGTPEGSYRFWKTLGSFRDCPDAT
jgi:hypothetical protein